MKFPPQYHLELVPHPSDDPTLVYPKFNGPSSVIPILRDDLRMHLQTEEVLVLICLNMKNRILGTFEVSRGSLSASIVHPREVFKRAILLNSATIILAHNHPSGDIMPSHEDSVIQKRIEDAGALLGVKLLDFMIVTADDYYSHVQYLQEERDANN